MRKIPAEHQSPPWHWREQVLSLTQLMDCQMMHSGELSDDRKDRIYRAKSQVWRLEGTLYTKQIQNYILNYTESFIP